MHLIDNESILYGGRYFGNYRYHGPYNFLMDFKSELDLPFSITYTDLKARLDEEKAEKARKHDELMKLFIIPTGWFNP